MVAENDISEDMIYQEAVKSAAFIRSGKPENVNLAFIRRLSRDQYRNYSDVVRSLAVNYLDNSE